jgi:hypothetical protein
MTTRAAPSLQPIRLSGSLKCRSSLAREREALPGRRVLSLREEVKVTGTSKDPRQGGIGGSESYSRSVALTEQVPVTLSRRMIEPWPGRTRACFPARFVVELGCMVGVA